MAPSKVRGTESSREGAVKELILYLWRKRVTRERAELSEPDRERRVQLTYDLTALEAWESGAPIIEIERSE